MLSFYFYAAPITESYTLSLHDALPICLCAAEPAAAPGTPGGAAVPGDVPGGLPYPRSEEHTSELQSRGHLVCRLLLEKKKTIALNKIHEKFSFHFFPTRHSIP